MSPNQSTTPNRDDTPGELIYVSWGGTGRGAALRVAYDQAADADQTLTYLAILDPPHFADLDTVLITLVVDELEWLLNAHLRTVADSQLQRGRKRPGSSCAPARSTTRSSRCAGDWRRVHRARRAARTADGTSVEELVSALRERTGADVSIVFPEAPQFD